jgi:hypothetical protein
MMNFFRSSLNSSKIHHDEPEIHKKPYTLIEKLDDIFPPAKNSSGSLLESPSYENIELSSVGTKSNIPTVPPVIMVRFFPVHSLGNAAGMQLQFELYILW